MISRELLLLLAMIWHHSQGERCHYVLHGKRGVIKSPNHPAIYPSNAACTWLIQVQKEHTITLKIKSFRLEGRSPSCIKDALMIYDGANSTAYSFNSPYCGRTIEPSLKSSSNSIFIKFKSDSTKEFSGFSIEYSAEKNCNETIYADSGTISSPNYPQDYPPNADCHWKIEASKGKRIKIDIRDFEMEGSQGGIDQCYDHIAFYDVIASQKRLIGLYCGKSIPSPITSKTNRLVIHLLSDATVFKRGFLMRFTAEALGDQSASSTPALNKTVSKDGSTCTETDFKCRNDVCIQQEVRCNQVDDCGDHSDELACAEPCSDKNGGCEHSCKTHPAWGSFCTCNSGYTLAADKKSCHDLDECSRNNGGCGDVCSNFVGGYKCECSQNGYQIGEDGKTCQDIDECLARPCEHLCQNTVGSYVCSCLEGFRPTSSGVCIDQNECAIGVPSCFDCINTIGSYRCNCGKGFVAVNNATRCEDVDECVTGEACSQLCTNTYGSYHCHCRQGFTPSGNRCIDVNECQTVGKQCKHRCLNSPGSYSCVCRSGFRLVNQTNCVADDDCRHLGPGACQHGCIKANGRIQCTCQDGYILSSNGKDCQRQFNESDCGIMKSFTAPAHKLSVAKNFWPWQAYLQNLFPTNNLQMTISGCMATFISKYYLITTAHCLYLGRSPIASSQLRVLPGFIQGKKDGEKELLVDEIIFHPEYGKGGSRLKNDIALIRLLKPISASPLLQPICINPPKKAKLKDLAYIISWGRVGEKRSSITLRESNIEIKNATKCSWLYPFGFNTHNMICAGYVPPTKTVCLADSGTPLMTQSASQSKWYLHGILVHGAGYPRAAPCSKKYYSNAYYDLTEYQEWIQAFVK
ncbi:suppressor of tumorigenicity 14 protein homolog [Rhopilema esculentum]|uniref:suppressor of tumorigenicity 14 protein homolog n=1 Tax=Rhopilema esculentum TaxID=499914 RepID=UPI0031DFB66A